MEIAEVVKVTNILHEFSMVPKCEQCTGDILGESLISPHKSVSMQLKSILISLPTVLTDSADQILNAH